MMTISSKVHSPCTLHALGCTMCQSGAKAASKLPHAVSPRLMMLVMGCFAPTVIVDTQNAMHVVFTERCEAFTACSTLNLQCLHHKTSALPVSDGLQQHL